MSQEPETTEVAELARQQQIEQSYQAGQSAFERGQYREAVQYLTSASALVNRNSEFGGEVQVWLVTAYEAAGQKQEAIALCQQLGKHPSAEIRKQSRQLLYILEAPQLKRPPEWLTEIPDLSRVTEAETKTYRGSAHPSQTPRPRRSEVPEETVDLSQVNTKDNAFVWLGLGATLLIVAGLLWFGMA